MEGGIANLAASYVASPPPPMVESSPPPPLVFPSPPPPPPHPHPPTPVVGFEAPVDDVVAKGSVSFAPGTTTYWETVSAPVPAPTRTLGFTRRLAQASSTDQGAYNQAVVQEEQVIAAANAQAAQDAAQAAHDQAVAENMQEQQAQAEANAEAEQATMLVQSQTLAALTAPAPAPTTSTTTTTDTATASHSALKAKEASSSMEGSVASMASR
jgi:thiol:disulfide interchange protein